MKRRGYGRAMLDGINTAMTEYVLCVDSDGQYDPKDFAGLWQNRMHASVIRGIRSPRVDSAYRIFMSFCFGLVFRMLFPSVYSDMSSPLTLFRRASLHSLHKQLCYLNEGFWWGFMGTCIKNNISIYELPCHHRRRVEGTTVVYVPQKILQIGIRNFLGIIKLWAA
jgi:glycosyltransferase involved in cell wall biosynthesis